MIDLISYVTGDVGTYDTQTTKAANILSVQLRSLEYAQDLGIDLEFFLTENFKFQNESFKAYLVEVLASNGINVAEIIDQVEALSSNYIFNISPEETSTGLVAR